MTTEPMTFEIVPANSGLATEAKTSLEIAFSSFFTEAAKWKEHAGTITEPKLARVARLELKSLRVASEKTRKELKQDSLLMGRAIDGAHNILLSLIVPIERALDDIEKQEERRIEAEKAALLAGRIERYSRFQDLNMPLPNLGAMTEDQFAQCLADAKTLFKAKEEAVAKAEADRIERERKEAQEREAQRLENIRLKAEAEAREKAIVAERAAAAKIQAEKDAAAAKERAIAEAKAKAEAEAREKEQAELRRLKAAAEARKAKAAQEKESADKAESERIAAEKLAHKKAAAAPDKDKLMAFVLIVADLKVPTVKSPEAQTVANEITDKIANFARWIEAQADKL